MGSSQISRLQRQRRLQVARVAQYIANQKQHHRKDWFRKGIHGLLEEAPIRISGRSRCAVPPGLGSFSNLPGAAAPGYRLFRPFGTEFSDCEPRFPNLGALAHLACWAVF